MKGQVLLTVDGGDFAVFTSYMDHSSVATKIKTRFLASFFMVADKILVSLLFSLQDNQRIFLPQLITTLIMNETTVNFVQTSKYLYKLSDMSYNNENVIY